MNRRNTLFLAAAIAAISAACDRAENAPGDPAAADAMSATRSPEATQATFAAVESGDPERPIIKARCAIDRVNAQKANAQTITVNAGGELRFQGWVSDAANQVPSQFTILLSGPAAYGAVTTAGIRRADVARALKANGLADSGFDVRAALGPVPPGEYAVAIEQDAGKDTVRCATSTRVVVTNPAG